MPAVRRLTHIAFNALTVLSLVLALLVAGLWVRSYSYTAGIYLAPTANTTVVVTSGWGFLSTSVIAAPVFRDLEYWFAEDPLVPFVDTRTAGIEHVGKRLTIRVRYWFVVGACAVLPLTAAAQCIRRRIRPS